MDKNAREEILAAIRRAAAELGRAPSRGELRRITGVSHYRVLAVFPTLREAVRAAGLEPNPKGENISTEDLLADWKRVAEKLGRRPSRAEYVREGRYSAGAFVGRFGSWSRISTAKGAKKKPFSRELTRKTRINQELEKANHKGPQRGTRSGDRKAGASRILSGAELHRHRGNQGSQSSGESVLHNFDRVPLAAVPAPLVGMRRVTESVAQMVVNTLMGNGYWPLAISSWPEKNSNNIYHGDTETRRAAEKNSRESTRTEEGEFTPRGVMKESDLDPSLAVNGLPLDSAQGSGLRPPAEEDDRWRRVDFPPHHAKRARLGTPVLPRAAYIKTDR